MAMTTTQETYNDVVGLEVWKEVLVVHTLPADEQCTIANERRAVRRILKAQLKRNRKERLGPMLIVCEATGGDERHGLRAAGDLGLSVPRAQWTRVRVFARYSSLVAQTRPLHT